MKEMKILRSSIEKAIEINRLRPVDGELEMAFRQGAIAALEGTIQLIDSLKKQKNESLDN